MKPKNTITLSNTSKPIETRFSSCTNMNKEKLTLAHTQLKKHRTNKFFHTGSSGKSKKLHKNKIKRVLFFPINFIYFAVQKHVVYLEIYY